MRISEKIIRVGLIVMIALSFYFSYMIWLNPTGFNNASTETDTGVNPSVQTYKQKSDLFLPLYLTWNDEDAIKETNSEAVIREIQEVINEATINDLTLRTYGEEQAFSKAQEVNQGVSLNYYTTFYLKDYEKTFEKELSLEVKQRIFRFPASSLTLKKTRSNLLILPINEWCEAKSTGTKPK